MAATKLLDGLQIKTPCIHNENNEFEISGLDLRYLWSSWSALPGPRPELPRYLDGPAPVEVMINLPCQLTRAAQASGGSAAAGSWPFTGSAKGVRAAACPACLVGSKQRPPPTQTCSDCILIPKYTVAHLRSACRLMPVDAASEMMAMCLSPSMKEFFSVMLTIFWLSSAHRTCKGKGKAEG